MSVIDINVKQNKKITLLFTILGVVTAVLGGFLVYQKLKHDKSQRELNALDKELRQLQLLEIKKKNGTTE
jgi:CHASE3 domain sensor protein